MEEEQVERLTDAELVDLSGHRARSGHQASRVQAFRAEAELTRRLKSELVALREALGESDKRMTWLTVVLVIFTATLVVLSIALLLQ